MSSTVANAPLQGKTSLAPISLVHDVDQATLPGGVLHHASKWGIEGFMDALALEVRVFNIEVTIVEPGSARTNFAAALRFPTWITTGSARYMRRPTCRGRLRCSARSVCRADRGNPSCGPFSHQHADVQLHRSGRAEILDRLYGAPWFHL